MTTVTIYRQDINPTLLTPNLRNFTADRNLPRKKTFQYETELQGEDAAHEAFHLTNCPEEGLTPQQLKKIAGYQGASVSVGDAIETTTNEKTQLFLCAPTEWIDITKENPIEKPIEKPKLQLEGENYQIVPQLYKNGRIALQILCEDGSPYDTPTVNLPSEPCKKNEVFVKNYSHYKEVTQALLTANIGNHSGDLLLPPFDSHVICLEITHPTLLKNIQNLRENRKEKESLKPSL